MKKSVFTAIFVMVGLAGYCQYAQADLQKNDSQAPLYGKPIQPQEKSNKFTMGIKTQACNIGLFGIEGEYISSNEYKYSSTILLN